MSANVSKWLPLFQRKFRVKANVGLKGFHFNLTSMMTNQSAEYVGCLQTPSARVTGTALIAEGLVEAETFQFSNPTQATLLPKLSQKVT